jgi:hypothetical protein
VAEAKLLKPRKVESLGQVPEPSRIFFAPVVVSKHVIRKIIHKISSYIYICNIQMNRD